MGCNPETAYYEVYVHCFTFLQHISATSCCFAPLSSRATCNRDVPCADVALDSNFDSNLSTTAQEQHFDYGEV